MAVNASGNDTLRDELASLPDETAPDYEDKIRDLIASGTYEHLAADLVDIARDPDEPDDIRFAAYFALQTFLWRRYEYHQFRQNIEEFTEQFDTHPMFAHQQAMYYFSRPNTFNLREALPHARDALERAPKSPGVMNLFAEIVAESAEQFPELLEDESNDLSLAIDAINSAIATNRQYAKYFANRARLYALKRRYGQAYSDIRHAIEIEPAGNEAVYALRIARYEHIRAKIDIRRESDALLAQQNAIADELRDMRSQMLQMVGLLAAVVGFIVTGFDIAIDYAPLEAAALLGVLAAALLIVFTGFGELTRHSASLRMRTAIVAIAATSLMGLSALTLWTLR